MSDDGSGSEEEEVNPLLELWEDIVTVDMPSSRLNDVLKALTTKEPKVLNLDACLPTGPSCAPVLQTLLAYTPKSVKTISLRFNALSPEACQYLIDFTSVNESVEVMYLNMTNMDEKYRSQIEANWRKHLASPRTDNQGWTLIRIPPENMPPEGEGEEG
jgi:hypothetical protein